MRRAVALSARRTAAACAAEERRPPLLILHGLFGAGHNFRAVTPRLAAHGDVVTADLRNHGSSPWDDDVSLRAMATDVLELIDDSFDRPPVLCGHSLGGKVAMVAACLRPAALCSLIVVDVAPFDYSSSAGGPSNLALLQSLVDLPPDVLGTRADADAALQSFVPSAGVRQFLLSNLLPQKRSWRVNLRAILADWTALSGFPDDLPPPPPTLRAHFIAGGRSDYLSTPQQRAAASALFPRATFECIRGAGHWVHADRPDEFVHALGRVLDGATPAAG